LAKGGIVSDIEEGVAKLESTLAGTRINAERALREFHQAMSRDLRKVERRASRAERRVEALRIKLKRARGRAARAEQALAEAGRPSAFEGRALIRRVSRKLRRGDRR
jgi:hypothetical protein